MSETGDTTPAETCPECGYGADDCAHGRPPIRVSRNDERLIAHALIYYAAGRDDSIRNGLAVGEKIDAPHNTRAARDRDRAIELSRRFR